MYEVAAIVIDTITLTDEARQVFKQLQSHRKLTRKWLKWEKKKEIVQSRASLVK